MDIPTKVVLFLTASGVVFWLINIFLLIRHFLFL